MKGFFMAWSLCLLLLAGGIGSQAVTLTLTQGGVAIKTTPSGEYLLENPVLTTRDDKTLQPNEARIEGDVLQIKYPQGTEIRTTLTGKTELTYTFSNAAGIRSFRVHMYLPFSLNQGGKWWAGDRTAVPFPVEKPATPFLFGANTGKFQFIDGQGRGLALTVPAWAYQQLQDDREWGNKLFGWTASLGLTAAGGDTPSYTVTVADVTVGDGQPVVVCDRYGQNANMDFPGKVQDDAELRADVARDEAYYAGLTPPKFDAYGGLPGSGAKYGLKNTGYFHVEKKGQRWLLVDPAGNAFFHLGVCTIGSCDDYTWTKGRENVFEWLPPQTGEYSTAFLRDRQGVISFYLSNLIRKYGKPYDSTEWCNRFIDRLRKWGFNSGGAFGGPTTESQFPYVLSLPLGTWDGGMRDIYIPGIREIFDPYNEKTPAVLDALFSEMLPKHVNDPQLIGYYLGNENAFEDIPRGVAQQPGTVAAKRKLVDTLRTKYQTIARFNAAWDMQAVSFDELYDKGLPVATQTAADDMADFTGQLVDAYFKVISDTFHKYDTHHMLIGCRWQTQTANNERLCRAAGKYVDVMSFNHYTYSLDKALLNRLYRWSGNKPFILSEFHYCSPADSGLPGGARDVGSQLERGLAYRNYVETAAASGFIVGIEWFSALDQAYTGRFYHVNGENGNIGLVSVADRPYTDMLTEMMKTNYDIYKIIFGERAPFVFNDPRFTKAAGTTKKVVKVFRMEKTPAIDGSLADWPVFPANEITGAQLVQGKSAGSLAATFRLCYDETNLYLLAEVQDATPMQNDLTKSDIWNGDGIELFTGSEKLDQGGTLLFTDRQLVLSAAKPADGYRWWYYNAPQQYQLTMAVQPLVGGKGYTLEAAIPFASLGITAPKAGQELIFDIAIDDADHGTQRLRQLVWNGIAMNHGDRSHWGRAKLL